MAERLVRLFGPNVISDNTSSPTTLWPAVPQGKAFIIRQVTAVLPATSSAASSASVLLGISTLDIENLIAGLAVTGSTVGATTEPLNLVTPITTGESVVAAYQSGASAPARTDYAASNTATWNSVSSTTDAASYATSAFTPQAYTEPGNIFFCITNTKAASPDAVTSITDSHTDGFTDAASIVTATTGPDRVSIWGAYAGAQASGSSTFDTVFGGTQTSAKVKAVFIANAGMAIGAPGTDNVVLQTATNTGTTETAQSVTMTPSAADTFQILVVQCSAVASSYSHSMAGTVTEMADGTLATPSSTSAAYLIYPAVTNPSVTIASAGTTWAAACIEVVASGTPTVTVSGIIIE